MSDDKQEYDYRVQPPKFKCANCGGVPWDCFATVCTTGDSS